MIFKKIIKRIFIRPTLKGTREDFLKHKKQALELVKTKVVYWNRLYNFKYNNIRIKNTQTRWGSCSGKGNLNFHYKILFLPDRAKDYLVVHELCHLGQMNHSKKFWDLVAKTIPDYKEQKKVLSKPLA